MIESAFAMTVINLTLLFLFSGSAVVSHTASAVYDIHSPYILSRMVIDPFLLIGNITLSFTAVLLVLKRFGQHMGMVAYELRCRIRMKYIRNLKKDMYKLILHIIASKALTDALFLFLFSKLDALKLLYAELDFTITIAIWTEVIAVLEVSKFSERNALFILLILIMLSLALLPHIEILSVFSYSSIEYSFAELIVKTAVWLSLFLIGITISFKVEFIT